jgi:cobaltochelatase CobN
LIALISAANTELLMVEQAARQLPADFPLVQTFLSTHLQTDEEIDLFLSMVGSDTRIFVVRVLGGTSFFKIGFNRLREFCQRERRLLIAMPGDQQLDPELVNISNVPLADQAAIFEYLVSGGLLNYKNLLLYLSDVYLSTAYGFEPPIPSPIKGLYHPAARDIHECAMMDLKSFRHAYWKEDRPAIGILFYRAHWQSGNLNVIDALVDKLEDLGCNVLPVFCYSMRAEASQSDGIPDLFTQYIDLNGEHSVDTIISMLSYAVTDIYHEERVTLTGGDTAEYLERLGIPIIQAISTSLTTDQWFDSDAGISPLDAARNVVMPEFDGRIIGSVLSFKERITEGIQVKDAGINSTSNAGHRSVTIEDRIDSIASLALRYAQLQRKPNYEKRICIVFTNFANTHGRIGSAVGLDTPNSVIELLHALKERGYTVGAIPVNGDILMEQLIAYGGYDKDFLTQEQMSKSSSHYTSATYNQWFANFPRKNQEELIEAWGEPPGQVYRNDGHVYVAGLQTGNIFIMIQPPRGFGDNPLAVYHSGDLIPTHQYLGAYRWLRDQFGADAIIHCGKHGTLEWLPGKGLGLSSSCYPELAISDIPVFYPFIINDPGEGTQAKRRMHACIIDHLIPSMTQAETYDELARLQQLLGTYSNAERLDPDKLPLIMQEIWDVVVTANLQRDLGLEERPDEKEYGEFIQHIDGYLCEIGDMQIRDGLHILGRLPEGNSLVDLALALIRLDAPGVMGIRRAIAEDSDIDYDTISDTTALGKPWEPESVRSLDLFSHLPEGTPHRTNGDILKGIESLARLIVERVASTDFNPNELSINLSAFNLPVNGATAATLTTLVQSIVPNLRRTSDEIENLLNGLEGFHVPAGPSGSPTRGMANVLPTGRNFYSVDVRAIPSPFAWKVGQQLGNSLLAHYLEKEGRYPESVGITVWGTSNMRTHGDDIAEILWLLGVSPIWQEENRRIKDLAVIPLKELGRPRIDVTVRMSGFFRDAFPGVVKLLDKAINMVADLDEPEDQNFIRRHTLADEEARLKREGKEIARARSRFRLFSNKPGAYGTGILTAINERNWETSHDLANIYLEWGGYAYTDHIYGEPAREEFQQRLADTEIAVQNQDNREHDIFDSDDYLQFHGGMIAAIRTLTGRSPVALFGDSSNPEKARVRNLEDEARRVFRARVANPKWLRSIQRHGYKGALEMAATVDYLFGYDATAQVVEDWMYEQISEKYIFDTASQEFLEKSNPWALREMTGRLLEAIERDMWEKPAQDVVERLKQVYLSNESMIEAMGEQS